MATQSEIEMEKALVAQLETLGYERLEITNERDLVANLKLQLEKHNRSELARNGSTGLTDDEFSQILSKLNRGDVFDRSKQLRKRLDVERAEGTTLYLELFDTRNWCQNLFQVCRQIKNSPDSKDIKIVMVTSKSQESDRFWGMKQGADGYLTKPFSEQELQTIIQRMI